MVTTAAAIGHHAKQAAGVLRQMPSEQAEQMGRMAARMATILPLIDGGHIHLPRNVVHATKA